jgi:hypothetical protein
LNPFPSGQSNSGFRDRHIQLQHARIEHMRTSDAAHPAESFINDRSNSGEPTYTNLTTTDINRLNPLHHDQKILYFRRSEADSGPAVGGVVSRR